MKLDLYLMSIFFFNKKPIIESINPLKYLSKLAKKLQFKRSH